MSGGRDERRDAARTKWGFAVFQIVFGAMVIWFTFRDGLTAGSALACVGLIVLGIGLIMHAAIARWFALGLCFLYVLLAFLLPLLMFLARPLGAENRSLIADLLFTAGALAFGGIGYRALGYYRSDLGRFEYRRDKTSDEIPSPGGSAQIMYSAGAWLGLLAILWPLGLTLPVWVVQPLDSDGTFRMSTRASQSSQRPDIFQRSLCRQGDTDVFLAYEYHGPPPRAPAFRVRWTDSTHGIDNPASGLAKLPEPGMVGFFRLGPVSKLGVNGSLVIDIDPDRWVDEDATHMDLVFGPWMMKDMPECDSMNRIER